MKWRPEEVRDAFAAALQHHATLMFKLRYADEAENAARDEVAFCRADLSLTLQMLRWRQASYAGNYLVRLGK